MNEPEQKPLPVEPEHLACSLCFTDIPASVALDHEGAEYIQHYFGIECMSEWQQRAVAG